MNFGFVYIWYDRKRKMYYVGCHWGLESDGYICSSNRMRKAYKRRPHDFKRRILSRVYTSRADLLEEEYHFLSLIKDEELGSRYYNLINRFQPHWYSDENKRKTVGQRISDKLTGRKLSPEHVAKLEIYHKENPNSGNFKPGHIPANTGKTYEEYVGAERAAELKADIVRRKKGVSIENSGKFTSERMLGENNPRYGKHFTDEQSLTLSKAKGGDQTIRTWHHEIHGIFTGINLQLILTFKEDKISGTNLDMVCKGRRHSCKGWRLVPQEQPLVNTLSI